jgi:hypothetical protein
LIRQAHVLSGVGKPAYPRKPHEVQPGQAAVGLTRAIHTFRHDAQKIGVGDLGLQVPGIELVVRVALGDIRQGNARTIGDVVAQDMDNRIDDRLHVEVAWVPEGSIVVEMERSGVIISIEALHAIVEGQVELDYVSRNMRGKPRRVQQESARLESSAVAGPLAGIENKTIVPRPAALDRVHAGRIDQVEPIIAVGPRPTPSEYIAVVVAVAAEPVGVLSPAIRIIVVMRVTVKHQIVAAIGDEQAGALVVMQVEAFKNIVAASLDADRPRFIGPR